MSVPKLSIVILALNEEENLRVLLPQLRWADEVVVVDGGSRDGGLEVARRHGARCVVRPFDNFAAQRNAGLSAASGDWVFFVDADERPTPRLVRELRRRIASENVTGYRVPIRIIIFGRRFRFSGTQEDRPLRLVRRSAGFWKGDVHERFAAAGPIGLLHSHLEHITLPTVPAFLGKMQRYTTLAAMARVERGVPPRRRDTWLRPALEFCRRLIWKQGWLDGPEGWAFCGLSGLSEWVLARKHRKLWLERYGAAWNQRSRAVRLQPMPAFGGAGS